uniref:Uncharacterized protein n=1 Tax=Rhizophora mucronata TaxID=61149 RepID=A0A2P2NV33_RHIMU
MLKRKFYNMKVEANRSEPSILF